MEGKTVILSVLIMTLVMAQIQVEAASKVCCPSTKARNFYDLCRDGPPFGFLPRGICAGIHGCKLVESNTCPAGYNNDILENSGDSVTKYCKLGCVSSMCGALITLQDSDASAIVNGAVEKCNNACSTFCNKGSPAGVEAA